MRPLEPTWLYKLNEILELKSPRKTDNSQIWVIGCSFAHGVGVSFNERFGQLIGNQLNLPVSFLTEPGTSIEWAADQILRSDIRKNDIVVWAITGSSRFTYLDDDYKIHHVRLENFDKIPSISQFVSNKFIVSNHMIYNSITKCEQVKNFLKKLSVRYIFALMPCNHKEHDIQMMNYISSLSNGTILFDSTSYTFLDLGDDGVHPGPLQHNWYAEKILNQYTQLYK